MNDLLSGIIATAIVVVTTIVNMEINDIDEMSKTHNWCPIHKAWHLKTNDPHFQK